MQSPNATEDENPVQINQDVDAAMETIARVEEALAARKLRCHSGSALGSLFATVRRLANDAKPLTGGRRRATFLRANEAVRIARAVEAALDDDGAKEAIHRVLRSDMNLATRQESNGKNALWELDLYRRLKLGQSPVRFEEPDLVVSLGDELGDYAIACKKVYSEGAGENAFKLGCEQLGRHGRPGIVAFNLDDLTPEYEIWTAPSVRELKQRLDEFNCAFVKAHQALFCAALRRGDCDGVLVSTSVISDVPDMSPPINVTRSTAVWKHGAGEKAQIRFNYFQRCLDRVLTLPVGSG
ncbi:hypothetical protein [Stenotrophomonas maltophilia]|uniref:hypothetical protein n=1 Tax=Stenotrophomonas maltophilia TaxID=40324 RepID=UPI0039C03A1B